MKAKTPKKTWADVLKKGLTGKGAALSRSQKARTVLAATRTMHKQSKRTVQPKKTKVGGLFTSKAQSMRAGLCEGKLNSVTCEKETNYKTVFVTQQTFPFQEAALKQQEVASTTSTGHANSPAPIIIRRKTTQTPKVFRRGQKQPCPVSQPGGVGDPADLEGLSSLMATPRVPPQGKITFQTHFTYHSIIITCF